MYWLFCAIYILIMQSIYADPLKVLHMSFHQGCIKDFEEAARHLNLDLTSWHISRTPRRNFDGIEHIKNDIFNISHNRAARIWEINKAYFDTFDVIVTSDTAPLARTFLQNGWKKPLIIWICNRFDYRDCGPCAEDFPDKEFYELFRSAKNQKNIFMVNYTAYEHLYAQNRKVDTGSLIIKPCGAVEDFSRERGESSVPQSINKKNCFFIPPRGGADHLYAQCKKFGIPVYTGIYNGPADLKDFKGIIHYPYAWSNLALFENVQLGLPHFVPSLKLLREWAMSDLGRSFYPFHSFSDLHNFHVSEWYCAEHKDILIYFDSWEDLKKKVETTDYEAMQKKIKSFGIKHKREMIKRWRKIFDKAAQI